MFENSLVSENTIPEQPTPDNSTDALLFELSSICEYLQSMEESREDFIELLKEELFAEPTEEELLLQIEKENADLAFRVNLLNTLNSINNGVVSQNALLEENNRLLEQSISMNSVSVNSVSQNAIITTKLEDYSLTDSLLLILIVVIFCFGIISLFFRKGD